MKLAITSTGKETSNDLDPRFGRAKFFIIANIDTNDVEAHDNVQNMNAAQGAGIQSAEMVMQLGAEALITGNVGPKAFRALNAAGIKVYLCGQATVADAIIKFKANELKEATVSNVEAHWA